jgi:hypothetical protein
VQNLKVA